MQSTTDIAAKWQQLQSSGLDLGSPTGPEADAGSGGRFQPYQNGRIYWHRQRGTHEVHGAILTEYLRIGGPGRHPVWGINVLGFPTSDEHRTPDNFAQVSEFEGGNIYWGYGADAVPIYGPFFPAWQGNKINLGYPLTESLLAPEATQVVFCALGCLFTGGPKNDVHPLYYTGPHSGRPQIVTPNQISIDSAFTTIILPGDVWQLIQKSNKNYFSDLWKGHLMLQSVNAARDQVPVAVGIGNVRAHDTDFIVDFQIRLAPGAKLADRTLYDLAIQPAVPTDNTTTTTAAGPAARLVSTTTTAGHTGPALVMIPHCVYAKANWTYFGAMHATDMHVSERVDFYHTRLIQLGLTESIANYNNYNESFRDTIHYANKLHDLGILDLLIVTGDLVDYQYEEWQDPTKSWGNFLYFEHILRGRIGSPVGRAVEELRVPIFTTLGNHDYRQNAYKLLFDADSGIPFTTPTLRNYLPHNLTEDDAQALQGGHPTVSSDTALDMVRLIRQPEFYVQRMNRNGAGPGTSSYIVPLGLNRLVILDSGYDNGIIENTWDAFKFALLGGDEDKKSFAAGSPNQNGVTDDHLGLVEQALREAGAQGAVIVGIHGPPLNVEKFNDFFRETEHTSADIRDIVGYLIHAAPEDFWITTSSSQPGNVLFLNNGIVRINWDACIGTARSRHPGWMNSVGQPYFMHGTVDDMLDADVSKGRANDLLKMCAGSSVPGHSVTRAADVVLCGHGHNNVEYRVRWTGSELQFFTDFYTGNPATYYGTSKASWDNGNTNIQVVVQPGATPNPQPNDNIRDHRWDGEEWTMTVPPYNNPLNTATDRPAWWGQHRPLILQTGAIGPLEERSNSRHLPGKAKPDPTFQGFRVMTVASNSIRAIYYVSMQDLRARQFTMPWEKAETAFHESPPNEDGNA